MYLLCICLYFANKVLLLLLLLRTIRQKTELFQWLKIYIQNERGLSNFGQLTAGPDAVTIL